MEFREMTRVHDVDPQLIERTRQWLLLQQRPNGAWDPEGHMLHEDLAHGTGQLARLAATAYIAWAVFDDGDADAMALATRHYLLAHSPEAIDDPYVLALVANALLAIDRNTMDAVPYLDRLDSMKQSSADGKRVWWDAPAGRTMFYGAGRSGSVETSSLATLAMLHARRHPGTARSALQWLIGQRDGNGTWYSTQATVLALKALLAGSGKPLSDGRPRHLDIRCDDRLVRDLVVLADQADVVQQIDLSSLVSEGKHRLTITDRNDTAAVYQVLLRYYVPQATEPIGHEGLSIDLAYDKTNLSVNDTVGVTATVLNKSGEAAPMVILDLPIPAGFSIVSNDLDKLVADGTIAKHRITSRAAVVYLRQLSSGEPLVLRYRLRATMPVKITAAPARAYEYYDPDRQASSTVAHLTVTAKE